MASIAKIIERALTATGSVAALARALNVAPSHVSRMRKGLVGVGPAGSVRLSYIIGRPALRGLRDDGYGDLADALEAFFNYHDDPRAVTRRAFFDDIDVLSPAEFRSLRILASGLANAARRSAATQR